MRATTRYLAMGLASVLLAACSHKDKDAPLAFVPADTPYVVANLDVLDDATRKALLAQADAQLPSQLAQMDAAADRLAEKDPDGARRVGARRGAVKGQTVESVSQNPRRDKNGYYAV
jgi:hypothetical protein